MQKVNKTVKRMQKTKKPEIVWRTRNKTVPVKKKVSVTETVWVVEKVQGPYQDWEYKEMVQQVTEKYEDWVTERVKKTVFEDRWETVKKPYSCPKQQAYTDYQLVWETKTVYEEKPVKKFRYETRQVRKKERIN